ncbi:MAG: carbonic anhydrase [Verrucomicrobia bacterium]|nr:MAG: carbonic anhydrase [Verrucomicrobiota bacterium]
MSETVQEILSANARYAANFGDLGQLPVPPARRLAILTCMDARLDPARFAGLKEGDAHVIRNAGGRASDDAIRSLVISYKLLGTREWLVIHHTDCGMTSFTGELMARLLRQSLRPATPGPNGWEDPGENEGSPEGEFVAWLTFSDLKQSVIDDVRRIRRHPLVPADIAIHGFIYECETGRLVEVPEASAIGRPA